jgi:cyclopentanol dehydrogenase
VAVNQTGTWLGMKAAVPLLRRSGGGSIVNVSSIFGLIGSGDQRRTTAPRVRWAS